MRKGFAAFLAIAACLCLSASGGPVALYKLDEPAGSGNPVVDSAGSNHGTLMGNPAQGVPGAVCGACAFDGAGDGVNVGNGSALKPADDFTVTFWFNPQSFTSTTAPPFKYERIIDATGTTGGIAAGYRVLLMQAGTNSKLRWLVRGTGGSKAVVNDTILQTGQWQFVAEHAVPDGEVV